MEKYYISANEYQQACFRLARQIYDSSWVPEILLALWRGGAVPGMIIHEFFDFHGVFVRHYSVKCTSYTGIEENGAVRFDCADEVFTLIRPGMRVLIVDDVFDTGQTAKAVFEKLPAADARFAAVYWKPEASKVSFVPDYYVETRDSWLVFPHELSGLSSAEVAAKGNGLAPLIL